MSDCPHRQLEKAISRHQRALDALTRGVRLVYPPPILQPLKEAVDKARRALDEARILATADLQVAPPKRRKKCVKTR